MCSSDLMINSMPTAKVAVTDSSIINMERLRGLTNRGFMTAKNNQIPAKISGIASKWTLRRADSVSCNVDRVSMEGQALQRCWPGADASKRAGANPACGTGGGRGGDGRARETVRSGVPGARRARFRRMVCGDCAPNLDRPGKVGMRDLFKYWAEREELEYSLETGATDQLIRGDWYRASPQSRRNTPEFMTVFGDVIRDELGIETLAQAQTRLTESVLVQVRLSSAPSVVQLPA